MRKPQGHVGKPPKDFLAFCIIQKNWQAPHDTQPTLCQRKGAGQGQLAGIACLDGLLILNTVLQLVKTNAFFVAGQRNHVANNSPGRQRQRGNTRVKRQHVRRHLFKISDFAMSLPNQRGQRIGRRQCAFNAPLKRLRMVRRQTRSTRAIDSQFLSLHPPNQESCQHGAKEEHTRHHTPLEQAVRMGC